MTLPKAFAIDQRHLGNICSKAQLEKESCAGRQAIGTVETRTPLLDAPLAGPAYAVSGFGKLPRLAFILDGQVRLIPQAESASVNNGHLRTVVPVVPDAPIGYFRLDLYGGNARHRLENVSRADAVRDGRDVGHNRRGVLGVPGMPSGGPVRRRAALRRVWRAAAARPGR